MFPGGFYHLHYKDESNWMRYAPIFLADFKKFSNKIIILAVNFNFIPIEVRGLLFDKYITKEMIEKNDYEKMRLCIKYKKIYE